MTMELVELRDSVRRVLQAGGLAAADEVTWSQCVELGWLWIAVPEELDGLNAGIEGACVLHHELGRCLSSSAFLPAMLAVAALCHSDHAGRRDWIGRIASGERVSAPLSACELQYENGRINGKIAAVQSAMHASHVLAWTEDHAAVGLVACDAKGVSILERMGWDQTRQLCDLQLSDVAAESFILLAEGEKAQRLVMRLLNLRDFSLAAESIGSANAFLEHTIEHLQARIQFGRPLALFQALKHRCADMKASIVAADAMLADALRNDALLQGEETRTPAMGAKLLATTMFAKVAEDCLQLHGGIGMASEHSSHLFLKRALLNQHLAAAGNVYAAEIAADFMSRTNPLSP